MKATLEEGAGLVLKDTSPLLKKNPRKKPEGEIVWVKVPSPPHGEPRYLNLSFKP